MNDILKEMKGSVASPLTAIAATPRKEVEHPRFDFNLAQAAASPPPPPASKRISSVGLMDDLNVSDSDDDVPRSPLSLPPVKRVLSPLSDPLIMPVPSPLQPITSPPLPAPRPAAVVEAAPLPHHASSKPTHSRASSSSEGEESDDESSSESGSGSDSSSDDNSEPEVKTRTSTNQNSPPKVDQQKHSFDNSLNSINCIDYLMSSSLYHRLYLH